jgi:pyruvate dehydrogenase (quinone)
MRAALEKRGVAVLVLSGDIALAEVRDDRVDRVTATESEVVPVERELLRAAELLNAGKKVTILAGAGAAGAHEQLLAIAEALKAPVVHALRGKEHVEYDNEFDVGMTGLLGFASGARAMEGCDTLLMLGTDFPYQQFYPDATRIQVDIRGEQLGRRTHLDLALVGGVRETIDALLPHIHAKTDRAHLDEMLDHYRKTRRRLDELATPSRDNRPIHPQYLARLVDESADDDAIFIPDVGSPVIWAARYLTMNGKRRMIGSFTHGSMASALVHGIGAQAANPGRQVVALAGDGGLTMMLGELLTLVQYKLPLKLVVFNNSSLNFIELEMKAAGFVTWGTGLKNPSFAAVAQAMGIHAVRVEQSSQLPGALKDVLDHDGPALLDVVTERQELSIPPTITAAQVKGFALYALRTVMSGRGDELVDLARTNIRQIL